MSINYSMKWHSIVKTSLDVTSSVRSCSIEITYSYSNSLLATLEVWSNRSCEDSELILLSRLNADNFIWTKHKWSDIKSCTASERWNPIFVSKNYLIYCIKESLLREYSHLKSLACIHHSLCVKVRTECYDMSIFCLICLKSFETRLWIMKNTSTLTHLYCMIWSNYSIIPFSILKIRYIAGISLYITKSKTSPIDIFLSHNNTLL